MSHREVRAGLDEAQQRDGLFAALEPELVAEFVPRELWPVVDAIALCDPNLAAARFAAALRAYSRSSLPGNRHRGDGTAPAKRTIQSLREEARRLSQSLVDLRVQGHPCEALAQWIAVPEIKAPDGGSAGVDTAAPRPEQVRIALATLDQEIAAMIGIRVGEDECVAIRALSPTAIFRRALLRPLRDRVMLLLLLLTGGRVTAIAELMRSDYVVDHKGVAPDYRHGPAIGLRPGKTIHLDAVRWKPLPPAAAKRIDAYLIYLERVFAPAAKATHRDPNRRDSPFSAMPQNFPLLVSNRVHFKPWGAHGIRARVSGVCPRERTRNATTPLIPRDEIANPQLSDERRAYIGYNPHAYRHLASQLAERAGRIWNDEHPETGGVAQPDPALYASALLDHTPSGDRMRALYQDRGTEGAYETLSGRAIEVIWELLMSDRGARKRPDLESIRGRVADVRAVDARVSQLDAELGQVHAAPRLPLPPRRIWQDPPATANGRELLELIHRQNSALAASQDLLHERVDAGEKTIRRLLELAEAAGRLREFRQELVIDLAALIHDPSRWERLPDSAPPGAEHVDIDLRALVEGAASPAAALEQGSPHRVRDWVTLPELAELLEIENRSTISRWAAGRNLPRVPAHRPWEAEAGPIDCSLGKSYRRIWIGGVRESFWATPGIRARVERLLRGWPNKQGWTSRGEPGWRCGAPLELPEPFHSERASILEQEVEDEANAGASR